MASGPGTTDSQAPHLVHRPQDQAEQQRRGQTSRLARPTQHQHGFGPSQQPKLVLNFTDISYAVANPRQSKFDWLSRLRRRQPAAGCSDPPAPPIHIPSLGRTGSISTRSGSGGNSERIKAASSATLHAAGRAIAGTCSSSSSSQCSSIQEADSHVIVLSLPGSRPSSEGEGGGLTETTMNPVPSPSGPLGGSVRYRPSGSATAAAAPPVTRGGGGASSREVVLLSGITGYAASGRLLAVMGPSGAGKTSLLNILAGESKALHSGKLGGRVQLNGRPRSMTKFKAITCHVRQVDVLLETATVREALAFNAALQLPPGMSRSQSGAVVDGLLSQLGLTHAANTLVGDEAAGIKGISGGERRRLAIGLELIRQPQLIFCDEPTTGLDSATALQVTLLLAQLATQQHRLVVVSIHQPSSEICSLFNDLLLLAPGGRAAYMGSWEAALPYFTQQLGLQLPPRLGVADWLMSLLTSSSSRGEQADLEGLARSSSSSTSSSRNALGMTSSSSNSSPRSHCSSCSARAAGAPGSWVCARGSCSCSSSSPPAGLRQQLAGGSRSCSCEPQWPSQLAQQQQEEEEEVEATPSCCGVAVHLPRGTNLSTTDFLVEAWAARTSSSSCCSESIRLGPCRVRGKRALWETASPQQARLSAAAEEGAFGESCGGSVAPSSLGCCCCYCMSHTCDMARCSCCKHQEPPGAPTCPPGSLTPSPPAAAGGVPWWGSWAREVVVLSRRSLLWWYRSPSMLFSELLQYGFAAVFLGSIYPRLPVDAVSGVPDRLSALFTFVVTLLVTAPSRALLAWNMERRMLRHEVAAGTYRLSSFLVSKVIITAPLEAVQVLLIGSGYYFLVGLQLSAAKFWAATAMMVLTAVNAATAGHMVGVLTPSLNLAFPILCVVVTLLLAFCGFIVQSVPRYWSWVGPSSFCSYAYAGLVRNEFEGLTFHLPASSLAAMGSSSSMSGPAGAAAANAAAAAAKAWPEGAAAAATQQGAALGSLQALTELLAAGGMSDLGQQLLNSTLGAAGGSSSHSAEGGSLDAANSSLGGSAAVAGTGGMVIAVEGLSLVPSSIAVGAMSVGGFIGVLAAFTVAGWVAALAATALAVKLRLS